MFSKIKEEYKYNKVKTILIIILFFILFSLLIYLIYKLSKLLLLITLGIFLMILGKSSSKQKEKECIKVIPKEDKKIKETYILPKDNEGKKITQDKKKELDKKELMDIKLTDNNDKTKKIDATLYKDEKKENDFHAIIKEDNDIVTTKKAQEEKKVYKDLAGYLRNNVKEDTIVKVNDKEKTIQILKEKIGKYGDIEKIENISNLSVTPKLIKETTDNKNNSNTFRVPNPSKKDTKEEIKGQDFLYTLGIIPKKRIKNSLTEEELILCARISNIIINNNQDVKNIDFYKDKKNYIGIKSTNIKFKVEENKKYLIVPKEEKTKLKTENCNELEDKDKNKRVLLNESKDIEELNSYINKEYKQRKKKDKKEQKIYGFFFQIQKKDLDRILKKEKEREIINSYLKIAKVYHNDEKYAEELNLLKNGIKKLKEMNINSKSLEKRIKEINNDLNKQQEKEKQKKKIKKID